MKILYAIHQFYPEYQAGTEKVFLNIAMMMQKAGNNVKVLTYSFYDDSFYDKNVGNILFKEFTYKGIPVIAFRHKKIPANVHFSLRNKDMADIAEYILKKEKPDVLHICHPMRMIEFAYASRLLRIPYTITLTDYFLICPKIILFTSRTLCVGPEKGHMCEKLCPELSSDMIIQRLKTTEDILLNAKKIMCPSRFVATIFKKEFKEINIKIIKHGIDNKLMKKNEKIYKTEDKIMFCYVGTIIHHKGVHILLDAFRNLVTTNAILKIYGPEGADESYIKKFKDVAKEDRRIEICGTFDNDKIGDIFSDIDVVVIPSLCYESYSLVLHEALSCNIPVIASNAGVMAEKITDGVNGYTFRLGDPNHLKETLETIIDDPTILNSLKKGINRYMVPTVEQETYVYEKEYKHITQSTMLK